MIDGVHRFEKDPDQKLALCKECGMWPEYHSHTGKGTGYGPCVCQNCISHADLLQI